jgi:DNA polymerase III epsilon subunit-like protein
MPSDLFFSADIESDGPVPGPYSMLSFALVVAGSFDGVTFVPPPSLDDSFYAELRPISDTFDAEALAVSGLSREALLAHGREPSEAMRACSAWVRERAKGRTPVLVGYPLGFDWSFLSYYFNQYGGGSPFGHSRGFDLKTAVALLLGVPVGAASRQKLPEGLRASRPNTHHALDDARAQAEILANLFAARRPERPFP